MTFGELKALVANFEALADETEVVINDPETGRLVNFHLHDASVVGRDNKNKQTFVSAADEKVLHVYAGND